MNNCEYFEYLEKRNNVILSEQQKDAINFDKGNALVLATAGSGKTTVIVARIGRVLYEKKCHKKILTITFSKMAADNMKNRFEKYFGSSYKRQTEFSTIHAFSYKIVREFYSKKGISFGILSNNYQVLSDILKKYYSNAYFNYIGEEEVENLASSISYINNMMIPYTQYKDFDIEIKDFDKIYEAYRSYKSENKLLDFDDMIIYAHNILSKNIQYRENIKNSYDFIQIDEMQDTSKIQHQIINFISDNNLFMVGDDDQAIYSFRGSNPELMLNFKDEYKDGVIFYLDNNYRSDKNIVEGAKKFIEKNTNRYKKNIYTNNHKNNEIKIIKVKKRTDQSNYILNEIAKIEKNDELNELNRNNTSDNSSQNGEVENIKVINNENEKHKFKNKSTIAILYRYNMSSMILANNLYKNNIKFHIREDKVKFFNSSVFRDIMAFLTLAQNPYDKRSFARIYYKSYTYFSKKMCDAVLNGSKEENVFDILYNLNGFEDYVYDRINQFRNDILYLAKLRPNIAIRFIKTELEYVNYLERMQEEGRYNLSNCLHILEILEEISQSSENLQEFTDNIYKFVDLIKDASKDSLCNIIFSTIHGAKGLEYDYVYMIDNIEDEFPRESRSMQDEKNKEILEEERRIFYVGMTRARKSLNIISPENQSLFVNELLFLNKKEYNSYNGFNIGDKVYHKKYKSGMVTDIKDGIVSIKFGEKSTKKFDIEMALEKKIIDVL